MAHEHGEPIDSIVFSEVMYCNKRKISGENPLHIDFIKNKAKPLFESWGYKVYIVHGEKDFLSIFNRIIENPRKVIEHKGKKYGFVPNGLCSVKRDCKLKPMNDFYKTIGDDVISYVGIAIDEPKRLESLHKANNKISLLEKYGYTEAMARQKCIEYGLLSPAYELSKRGGCWFCPNAKLCEHKYMRDNYRDIWNEYVSLENEDVAFKKWNTYSKFTLHEIDEMLELEDAQMTIFDYIGS